MPIDIKWVRQDPGSVEEWHRLRKLPAGKDLVAEVLRRDEVTRMHLQTLEHTKRSLAGIKRQLRPSVNSSENAETDKDTATSHKTLLEKKKELEMKIGQQEIMWKESKYSTQATLYKLASPVDIAVFRQDSDATEQSESLTTVPPTLKDGASLPSLGLELQSAWKQYTLQFFSNYTGVQLPCGVRVQRNEDEVSGHGDSIDLDMAHAIWGCCDSSILPSDDQVCYFCQPPSLKGLSTSERSLHEPLLPTWIRLLLEYVPPKSIWGDKQLPAYTAAWSESHPSEAGFKNLRLVSDGEVKHTATASFSLDLVALTAPSMVDARQAQNDMINQLTEYYEGLMTDSPSSFLDSCIFTRPAPPARLHPHEHSRIEILARVLAGQTRNTSVRLGKVSCWGDAASRACDMEFAGGGGQTKRKSKMQNQVPKEYVYIVQASVVDMTLWDKILFANRKASSAKSVSDTLVGISSVISKQMKDPLCKIMDDEYGFAGAWIRIQDLIVAPYSKKNRQITLFGPLDQIPPHPSRGITTELRRNEQNLGDLTFPLLSAAPADQHSQNLELLSCPFNFLFT